MPSQTQSACTAQAGEVLHVLYLEYYHSWGHGGKAPPPLKLTYGLSGLFATENKIWQE